MINKSYWTLLLRGRGIKQTSPRVFLTLVACILAYTPLFAAHNQAPEWMHALVGVPLPAHDEKTDAISLYSEQSLTVTSTDKFRRTYREAYKILRPAGRERGVLQIPYDTLRDKIISIHAWCIPSTGKDYEVTDKDALEASPRKGEDISLITSVRYKVLLTPAPDPGNIIGFEYVIESHPEFFQDFWGFQEDVPVRDTRYSVTIPAGWQFKATWSGYPEVKPHDAGGGLWQWSLADIKEIREEASMPPLQGFAGLMVVTLIPPGGPTVNSPTTWQGVADWYLQQSKDALGASPEIKQQVSALTASAPTPLAKMRAIAEFIQRDFRYVQISLKIGGFKPHPAGEVFNHRYGDCKDKATLMIAMLREIGVDSYYVFTNGERDAVTPATPPHVGSFDHAIIAIKLPDGLVDPSLNATMKYPKVGTLLIFDPTNEKTPFGQIGGYLQANYSLVGTPSGAELVALPQQPAATSGLERKGKFTLTISGSLKGDVEEVCVGDSAFYKRYRYVQAEKPSDRIKPVESLLADSLSTFHIAGASVSNVEDTRRPFIWNYSFQAENYAKYAGNLLLVRPRVMGKESPALLETSEPRRYPVEFEGPERDTDDFEIAFPPSYAVDDLPPPVDADFGFASYHSKTEVAGNVLRYHRILEVKELSVPLSEVPQLKKFYRIIASDERNTAVLKLVTQ